MALSDQVAPSKPPNLREGTATRRCQFCRHWDGQGTCKLYGYPTDAGDLCDSYSPKGRR